MTDKEWLKNLKPLEREPIPLQEAQMKYVLRALKYYKWNIAHTAKALDISIRGLRNKLDAYRARGVYIPEYIRWSSAEHKELAAKLDGLSNN